MIRLVAEFPRPPAIERVAETVRIVLAGETICGTGAAWRILETFHPPTYYLPVASFRAGVLVAGTRTSFCEWKGVAIYYALQVAGRVERDVAWGYPEPSPEYAALKDHVAVYAGADGCLPSWVGALVTPQPGGFYGGWITPDFEGAVQGRTRHAVLVARISMRECVA